MPLDKNTYLHVQCFINLLEASFPSVKYTAFLYNDQLVWYASLHCFECISYMYICHEWPAIYDLFLMH